jgi:predicted alpha/beta hydrolase
MVPAERPFVLGQIRGRSFGVGRAVVVVAPATGAPAGYYAAFARALAAQGLEVWTFDYRGIGKSPGHAGIDLTAWAEDLACVLAAARAGGQRVHAVLHSISGFLVGLSPELGHLAGVITVGAQTAYPFDLAWRHRLTSLLLWHGLMPALTLACGEFPARRLGLGANLPRGVALDWARRVLVATPRGLPDHFASLRAPLLCLAATDDHLASPRALERLHRRFSAARLTTRRIAPGELGVRHIGHLGLLGPVHGPRLAKQLAPLFGG